MKRYALTLKLFWSTAIAAEMEYRANFVLAALQSLGALGGAILVLWSLFRTGYEMGGWSWPQALLVVAAYTVLDGFQATVLAPNREQVGEMVREGSLDFVLLKPIDTQFWLSTRKLRIWGLPNLLLGLALAVFALTQLYQTPANPLTAEPGDIAVGQVFLALLRFILPMTLGIVILYALGYILSTVTVWFVKMNNITTAMQALLEAGRYPVTAYPHAYRVFFTFILPVAFMTTVPAQFVIGQVGGATLAVASAIALGLLGVARLFWRFALHYYTSASS
ncbi:MAG: ABC-2 family transporter protein [Planctomycetota bacterium]